MIQNWLDANMLKGGIAYSNKVTTVSNTYAWEDVYKRQDSIRTVSTA